MAAYLGPDLTCPGVRARRSRSDRRAVAVTVKQPPATRPRGRSPGRQSGFGTRNGGRRRRRVAIPPPGDCESGIGRQFDCTEHSSRVRSCFERGSLGPGTCEGRGRFPGLEPERRELESPTGGSLGLAFALVFGTSTTSSRTRAMTTVGQGGLAPQRLPSPKRGIESRERLTVQHQPSWTFTRGISDCQLSVIGERAERVRTTKIVFGRDPS